MEKYDNVILEPETVEILKNFSRINTGIFIKKNSGRIATCRAVKNILAEYTQCQSFPVDIVLYDLNRFINLISSYSAYELEFTDTYLTVVSGIERVRVYFSDPELIVYPTKTLALPNCVVQFDMTESMLDSIIKKSRMLDAPDIRISNWIGEEKGFFLQVFDCRSETSSSLEISLGEPPTDEPFEFFFSVEYMKMLPADYTVKLSDNTVSEFKAKSMNLTYWVAMNTNSVPPGATKPTENQDQDDEEYYDEDEDDSQF